MAVGWNVWWAAYLYRFALKSIGDEETGALRRDANWISSYSYPLR